MNELDSAKELAKRRGRRLASILWWIAAGLSVLVVVLEYIKTGKVAITQAVLAALFIFMAIAMQRAKAR